jgi:CRISPR-associated protein Cst2
MSRGIRVFGTVVTNVAPSANHTGESELNRSPLQKMIGPDGKSYAYFSSASLRNGFRETARSGGLRMNRSRVEDANQPTVRMADFPCPEEYFDDFVFGYLIAKGADDRDKILEEITKRRGSADGFRFKRNSVFRINYATALSPYRYDTTLSQSPFQEGPWNNDETSSLLHREVSFSAFQYPFSLDVEPFVVGGKQAWGCKVLELIGQLNGVAGNHARTLFTFDPASIVVRVTNRQVPGYDPYGFTSPETFDNLIEDLKSGDLPGEEFWLGGRLVKALSEKQAKELDGVGVHLRRSPQKLLAEVAEAVFPPVETKGTRKAK